MIYDSRILEVSEDPRWMLPLIGRKNPDKLAEIHNRVIETETAVFVMCDEFATSALTEVTITEMRDKYVVSGGIIHFKSNDAVLEVEAKINNSKRHALVDLDDYVGLAKDVIRAYETEA